MTRLLVTLLLIATFCLGAAVSYYNWSTVPFHYLAGQIELPLIALLLAAFVLGMLVAGLLNLTSSWSLKREGRKLQRLLNATEVELKNLRNLPLADAAAPGIPQGFPAVTSAGDNSSFSRTPAGSLPPSSVSMPVKHA